MPRRPPRVLVAASAVLLAAVVALWVRSYFAHDAVEWWRTIDPGLNVSTEGAGFGSCRGRVRLWHCRGAAVLNTPSGVRYHRYKPVDLVGSPLPQDRLNVRFAGGQFLLRPWSTISGTTREVAVVIPYWLLFAAAMALVWASYRRRKPCPTACRSCGYDLTANTSGRCPECGAEVPAVAAAERRA